VVNPKQLGHKHSYTYEILLVIQHLKHNIHAKLCSYVRLKLKTENFCLSNKLVTIREQTNINYIGTHAELEALQNKNRLWVVLATIFSF